MPVIIDCYNLLHVAMPPPLAGLDVTGLCRLLAYRRGGTGGAGDGVIVVCDGTEQPGHPAPFRVKGVKLMYAGGKRSADDVIISLIDADSAPRRLVVVSSDRQIQKAARRRRATTMSSERFVGQLLHWRQRKPGPSDKPLSGPLTENQVKDWLKEFGLDDQIDDDRDT